MFFIFSAFMAASWFIKYPDVIKASVLVTTKRAPIYIVSQIPGKITLLKKENDEVIEGDLIGYIQSNTSLDDVLELDMIILAYRQDSNLHKLNGNLSKVVNAGDLQSNVNNTREALEAFITHNEIPLFQERKTHLKNRITYYTKLKVNLNAEFDLQKQETAISAQNFSGDSTLFNQDSITLYKFNESRGIFLRQQRSLKGAESSIILNDIQIQTIRKEIMELEMEELKDQNELKITISFVVSELVALVKTWKEKHLFLAPAIGQLAFMGFLQNDQFIEAPAPVFAVLPRSEGLLAQAELPIDGAGKVKARQTVRITLLNYPEEEFGTIKGIVKDISRIPKDGKYRLTISLPNGLETSYNSRLHFKPQLQGEAKIITEDFRLLERFFQQFRSLIL